MIISKTHKANSPATRLELQPHDETGIFSGHEASTLLAALAVGKLSELQDARTKKLPSRDVLLPDQTAPEPRIFELYNYIQQQMKARTVEGIVAGSISVTVHPAEAVAIHDSLVKYGEATLDSMPIHSDPSVATSAFFRAADGRIAFIMADQMQMQMDIDQSAALSRTPFGFGIEA